MLSMRLLLLLTLAQALCALGMEDEGGGGMLRVRSSRPMDELSPLEMLRRSTEHMMGKRQENKTPTTAVMSLDLAAWDKTTTERCEQKLATILTASNPAGMSVCYNLPFLDNKTGVFAADLRLYSISQPDATWAAVGNNVSVELQYDGAQVHLADFSTLPGATNASTSSTPSKRSIPRRRKRTATAFDGNELIEMVAMEKRQAATPVTATQVAPTQTSATPTPTTTAVMLQAFHFIGQINPELLNNQRTDVEMQPMLIPKITLVGSNPSGEIVRAALSGTEATFVSGVFATEDTNSTADAAATATPFVLPGTAIGIVPVGLYLFSGWMLLGVGIVLFGTFERWKFRDQYRRRVAIQTGKGKAGI